MRVAVKTIDGIDSVAVSLNRGLVFIRLRANNRVTLEQVREVIRQGGFTPKDAQVRVRGTVVPDSGHLTLALPGIGVAFRLVADAQPPGVIGALDAARGHVVIVEGRVPETARGTGGPPRLEARVLSKDSMR